jgi:hypothetical protein
MTRLLFFLHIVFVGYLALPILSGCIARVEYLNGCTSQRKYLNIIEDGCIISVFVHLIFSRFYVSSYIFKWLYCSYRMGVLLSDMYLNFPVDDKTILFFHVWFWSVSCTSCIKWV